MGRSSTVEPATKWRFSNPTKNFVELKRLYILKRNYPRLYKFYINRLSLVCLHIHENQGLLFVRVRIILGQFGVIVGQNIKSSDRYPLNDSKNIFELYLCLYSDLMPLLFKREMNYEMCSSLINLFYIKGLKRAFERLIYLYVGFWWFGIGPLINFSSHQSFRWFMHMSHVKWVMWRIPIKWQN